MTALAFARPGPAVRPALIVGGLVAIVGLRWAATGWGSPGALAVGLVFGIGLLAVAALGGWRPTAGRVGSVALGVGGGAVLVALALTTRTGAALPLAPAAPFGPWAAVTILVACAEEAVLRGALFTDLDRSLGTVAAVLVTSVLFALIHVPLYGWHVVPLDIGVGIWLAGLRLAGGGIGAPAIAHTLADLATWWL